MFAAAEGAQEYFRRAIRDWCAREDLNLQPLRDQILSLARLPFRHARNP